MTEHDDQVSVSQMLEAAAKAVEYTGNIDFEVFRDDELRTLAVTRLLEIVGEAARRVSDAFREAHPEIEWVGIVGLRNHITHGYDTIDLQRVWQICTEDLPELVSQLQQILE